MALIDDIRVNGQQSSATLTPIIAGLSPVITWDYLDDPAAPSQSSFDLQIGTSDTDWGTAAFVANTADVSMLSSGNVYEYIEHSLSRSVTYYGQVRVIDVDGDATLWGQFSFITNQLPFVTNFYLFPASPDTLDSIDLIYTYTDPDGHDQSGTKIRWFKNNLPQPAYDDLCTLSANATNPADSWTAKIIPSDGLESGALVETQAVIVSSTDTGIENLSILPVDANVDDLLQIEYDISETEYSTGIVIIEWYVNDTLIEDSNKSIIRLELDPGDIVYAIVKLTDGDTILAQARSLDKTIDDVPWYVFNLEVSGLTTVSALTDLEPILSWDVHKTTAASTDRPDYLRVLVTKTPSLSGPISDTGLIAYTTNSYAVPSGVLQRGQHYFVHVVATDETAVGDIETSLYQSKEVNVAGSSWAMLVDNATGWTIEFKVAVASGSPSTTIPIPNLGLYIHDGTYFCTITLAWRKVTFLSDSSVSYTIPDSEPDLSVARTFRIAAMGTDLKILMDNSLILSVVGGFSHESQLKFIEYGDIDGKNINHGTFRFFRYSTNGPYGFGADLSDENTFYFAPLGALEGGSIDYVLNNIISWLPNDTDESAKLIEFNENSGTVRLPTTTKNFSPITSIYIDENRNKYIGTANGVTAIFGERHAADYSFGTTATNVEITPEDFDRISNVPINRLSLVEPDVKSGWFTIDTTYRSVGEIDTNTIITVDDEYNPYINPIISRAIHYYTQRTHGHAWFDKVDNERGWQAAFSFQLETLEADDFEETNMDKSGFGVYVNDGTYQEILYFYDDRIRLFYANVYVPIITTAARDYAIVGKGNSLKIYQKLRTSAGSYQLLVDGSGLFTTPSTKSGNSTKPKIVIDSTGIYHAVWHDDTNTRSQIFYSSYDGSSWSVPEQITTNTQFNMRNPDIDVDSLGRAWVAYEDTSWGRTEITVSVHDDAGWNPKTRITNYASDKAKPSIKIDNDNDAHVVWEDSRNGHWEIFAAQWNHSSQSWTASGQFASDSLIVTSVEDEAYIGGEPVDYHNPELAFSNDTIWITYEARLMASDGSLIYLGSRQVGQGYWRCTGSTITDDDGLVIGFGESELVSPPDRNCVNPCIAVNPTRYSLVIAWEDQTEPIAQIWGSSRNTIGDNEIVAASQLTSQSSDCIRPDVGFIGTQAVILFEIDNTIRMASYNTSDNSFMGSAVGGTDIIIQVDTSKSISNPAIPPLTASTSFKIIYDFLSERDPYTLSTTEFPEFRLIGDALVDHAPESAYSSTVVTSTVDDGMVSIVDTKEFSFGDFSDNVGMLAHWRNIEMYFGYDAHPFSRAQYNSSTVSGWQDNRINDLFVDTFGNLVVATFGGLYYYNVFTADLTVINGHTSDFQEGTPCSQQLSKCLLYQKLTTAVKWGGNGIWYVGTTSGAYFSRTAGRVWESLSDSVVGSLVINDITVNRLGDAVVGTNSGVYVLHPDKEAVVVTLPDQNARVVGVDDNDIIWVGTNSGLFRVENFSNILSFGINQGMRSSHVNDISIVNKNLRYIATATGVERMHGMKFTNFNVHSAEILNDNISALQWDADTNSLWVGSLYKLHEIVFRDSAHEIIENEVVEYDNTDISTERVYDTNTYLVLDFDQIQPDPNNPLSITNESATVYINKNKIEFGFLVGESGESILFLTDLLVSDQVEVEASNKFIGIHDFDQKDIEISVRGQLRRSISKMDRTSRRQLLLLSGLDKPGILLFTEESIGLPFTTILLDRELPIGCLEKMATLTRTRIRFRVLAYDALSGIDGYILSNYENFTTDGETPQDFQPIQTIVEHDIGGSLTNVFDSLSIPTTVTIDVATDNVGTGSSLGTWVDESVESRPRYLYAATSSPVAIFRFDPTGGDVEDQWTGIQVIDTNDQNREVTGMRTINNILFLTTGTVTSNSFGTVYRTVDGLEFQQIGTVTGTHARGIAGGPDGTVYFGSSDGDIYAYKDGVFQKPPQLENIGETIYSLDVFGDMLVAGTGDRGRVYTVNLETFDNLIVFDGTEDSIEHIHIKDALLTTSPNEAMLFVSASDSTTIYRSDMDSFDFVKSYNSYNKTINKVFSVDASVLIEPGGTTVTGTTTVAIIGEDIFKFTSPSWEFVYKHSETIRDFIQYESNGVDGIWIISDSKVTKWTAVLSSKTVFLKLRDKAGNVSRAPLLGSENICPDDDTTVCCDYAYSINIADLKGFVNESRIVDITEYGEIQFTYESPNSRLFYSADQIDEEIGVYTSEVFNGSNELVSWKSITWSSTEPTGTTVHMQIRSGVTEDDAEEEEWSSTLVKNSDGIVSLEHVTNQYLQFRAILTSNTRDISPSLASVTLRNVTAQASHFFTTNFALPSRPVKGILTANTFIPVSADIIFGINTNDSADFGDYQIIESNRIFTTSQNQFGTNLRVGAKLLSPGIPQIEPSNSPGDPYDASSYVCTVQFSFENIESTAITYHFRIRFYNDLYRTQLIHTFYSGNDQTGWEVADDGNNIFPATGAAFAVSESRTVSFVPGDLVEQNQKWYIWIQAFDVSDPTFPETVSDNESFICSACNIVNDPALVAEYYNTSPTSYSVMPEFGTLTPDNVLLDTHINFDETTTSWVTSLGTDLGSDFVDMFAARWRGRIQAPVSGTYTFYLNSDDGSLLLIDRALIVDNDGLTTFSTQASGSVSLTEGFHDIELQFFHHSGDAGIVLRWATPGDSSPSVVPANRLYHAVASEYCTDVDTPRLLNFALLFELENGEFVKVNLEN